MILSADDIVLFENYVWDMGNIAVFYFGNVTVARNFSAELYK